MDTLDTFSECQHILVVAAHPDDLETMCGGTLIYLLEQGKRVDLLLATDGDLGAQDDSLDKPSLADRRRQETRQAGELLGLHQIRFLGYPDGELMNTLALRREVAYAYRLLQPDTLFTFDPLSAYRANLHPDHLAIAQAALDAFMPAKMPLYYPEQLSDVVHLSRVRHIFCFATPEPDIVIPIDEVYGLKLAASRLHSSQFPRGDESLEWMMARDRATAKSYGAQSCEYAEAFRRIETY